MCICNPAVWLVLGADELGRCRTETEREAWWFFSGARQFRSPVHTQPQFPLTRSYTSHTYGALQRYRHTQVLYRKYAKIFHIFQNDKYMFPYSGTFSLWCHPKFEDRCHSVVEFIERAIMHSKNGKFLYFLRSRVPGNLTLACYFKIRLTHAWKIVSITEYAVHVIEGRLVSVSQDSHQRQCSCSIQSPASVMSNPCSTFAASVSDSLSA